jgi:primosomal protein N' (replication factor Y) (superfamily II helicase)
LDAEEPRLIEPGPRRAQLPPVDDAVYGRAARRPLLRPDAGPPLLVEEEMTGPACLVDVVVEAGGAPIPQPLTYAVPPGQDAPATGAAVLVSLRGREQAGYVVAVRGAATADPAITAQPLLDVLSREPAFSAVQYELARWLAQRYHAPLDDALHCIVPLRHGSALERFVRLSDKWPEGGERGRRWPSEALETAALVRAVLAEAPGNEMAVAALERVVRPENLADVLARLRRLGWTAEERRLRRPRSRARVMAAVYPTEAMLEDVRLTERQRAVLDRVGEAGEEGILLRDLTRSLDLTASVPQALAERGLVAIRPRVVSRLCAPLETAQPAPALTPAQGTAAAAITASMQFGGSATHLLFGVTGSGKTEVYLHCFEAALRSGRPAIYLVPEISLTAQVATQFRARFGARVAVLHSRLAEGERFDEWQRVRRGDADIIVGPRSALFAPCAPPAIIVLDEEHDPSYKQESSPRYWAPDAAARRAALAGSTLVLGSATPAVESFHAAQHGRFSLLEMPERILGRPLPTVEVVDLRVELRRRPGTVFGEKLEEAVRLRLDRGEQVILFLNRRGFSAFILCRDCGYVAKCPNCNVSLVYHRQRAGRLVCHHCAYSRRAPDQCPRCAGRRIRHFGIGTERVESAVRSLFPDARVARLDRDSTARKDSHTRIVKRFQEREIDILVGTQMVAKGFDFPGVTLVGVITADTALHLPDFRAGERTFQLLSQVSGRAGRGEQAGEVVVQTFQPEHFSIEAAARHDYRSFFEREIREREELGYPPFASLARIVASDVIAEAAEGKIHAAQQWLADPARERGVTLLGPSEAPLARINQKYRWHLLLKSPSAAALEDLLAAEWSRVIGVGGGGLTVDVDPQSVL